MKWYLLATMGLVLALPGVTEAGADKPKAIFRVHLQVPEDGLSERQAFPVVVPPTGDKIFVRALPEISERDVYAIVPQPSSQGPVFCVKLSPHGTLVLSTITGQNQGQQLVVFLNGRVLYAPVIDTQINSGILVIPRAISPEELAALQETLKQNNR